MGIDRSRSMINPSFQSGPPLRLLKARGSLKFAFDTCTSNIARVMRSVGATEGGIYFTQLINR